MEKLMYKISRPNSFIKLITLLIILSFTLLACGSSDSADDAIAPDEIDQVLADFVPAISASGIVVPIERALLSVSFGGVVEQVHVEVNESVSAGDVLLSLSGSEQMQAGLAGSQLELIAAEQALADLRENTDLFAANAKEALEDAQRDYDNISTPAPKADIDQAYANLVLLEDQLETAQENFDEHAHKPEDNLVRASHQSKLSQVQSNYDNAVRIYNAYSTPGNLTDIAIAEAELEIARQAYEDAKDGPDPDALALAQARVDNAAAQVAAASAALQDIQLSAPFDGSIGQILVRENEWVVPGQPAVAMGDFSAFHVETTDLNEVDVAGLQIGDPALVTFDSLPGVEINAHIMQIASKSTPGEGVNYKVTLELDDSPDGLLWDMTALVEFPVTE
jgi:HlyD family secretion protein